MPPNTQRAHSRPHTRLPRLRVQAAVCALFRESLGEQGFVEVHTPKLVPGASEGGADAFRTDFFGQVRLLPNMATASASSREPLL